MARLDLYAGSTSNHGCVNHSRLSLWIYLLGETVSLFGNAAMTIVLPWLVLARTGDPALTGLVAAIAAAPSFLATLVSGHLIDKVGRRRMSVLSDVGSALSVAAMLIVDVTVGLDVGWFILLGVAGALFDVPGMTARETLMPNVATTSGVALERIAGARQITYSLAMLAGPGIAGGLLVVLEPVMVLAITAGCSGLAAVCMAVMPLAASRDADEEWAPAGALAGWRFVRSRPGLMAILVVSLAATVPVAPLLAVILPAHFSGIDRPDLLGLSMSAFAVGSIVGSLAYAAWLSRWRWWSWVAAIVLFMGGLGVVAPLLGFGMIAGGMLLGGAASGLMGPVSMVVLAEHVPDAIRGRVVALFTAMSMVTAPLGLGAMALLLSVSDIGVGAWACLIAFVPAAAYAVVAPGLREFLERPKEEELAC